MMKSNVMKRVWAWLLVACMLFTMVPAFAEEADVIAPEAEASAPVDGVEEIAEGTEEASSPAETPSPVVPAELQAPEEDEIATIEDAGIESIAEATPTPSTDWCPSDTNGHKHKLKDPASAKIMQAGDCTQASPKGDRVLQGECELCGFTQATENIGLPHNWVYETKKAATCTADGFQQKRCSECRAWMFDNTDSPNLSAGDNSDKKLPATGHHYVHNDTTDIAKQATCFEEGEVKTFHCDNECCMKDGVSLRSWTKDNFSSNNAGDNANVLTAESFVIPKREHILSEGEHKDANCTENERMEYHCTQPGCTYTTSEDVPNGETSTGKHTFTVLKPGDKDGSYQSQNWSNSDTDVNNYHNHHKQVCSVCGALLNEDSDGELCTYTKVVTESTCTTAGKTVWTCTVCGGTVTFYGKTDPTAHVFTSNTYLTKDFEVATCNDAGHEGYRKCDECGLPIDSAGNAKPASGSGSFDASKTVMIPEGCHSWGTPTNVTEATCTKEGSQTVECQVCHTTDTQTLPKKAHELAWRIIDPATCTDNAKGGLACKNCDYVAGKSTVYGTALGHDFDLGGEGVKILKYPTCEKEGKLSIPCTRCDAVDTESENTKIPATGHSWVSVEQPNRCDKTNFAANNRQCTVCGIVENAVDATDTGVKHDFDGDGKPDEDANSGWQYNGNGTHIRRCHLCPWVEIEDCNQDINKNIAANCKDKGWTITICSKCKNKTETENTTGATDSSHHIGADPNAREGIDFHYVEVPGSEATCTSAGTAAKICKCGATLKYETVEAHHNLVDAGTGTPATCDKPGTIVYKCTRCDYTETESVPATNEHKFIERDLPETCTSDRKHGIFCEVCGKVDPRHPDYTTVPNTQLEHQYDFSQPGNVIVKGDCETPTQTEYTCILCKTNKTTVLSGGQGKHTAPKQVLVDATCTTPQQLKYVCENCGKELLPRTGVLNGTPALGAGADKNYPSQWVDGQTHQSHWVYDYDNNRRITWDAWKTAHAGKFTKVNNATCSIECPTCGELIVVEHEFEEKPSTANCLYPSAMVKKCTLCNYVSEDNRVADPDAKRGSHYVPEDGTEPEYNYAPVGSATCKTGGFFKLTCKYCGGFVRYENRQAGEHLAGDPVVVKSTCLVDGTTTVSCKICGEQISQTIQPKLSDTGKHLGVPEDRTLWHVDEEATPEQDGKRSYVCDECGETVEETYTYEGELPACEHVPFEGQLDESGQAIITYCTKCYEILAIDFGGRDGDCTTVYVTDDKGVKHMGKHFGYDAEGNPDDHAKEEVAASEATCTKEGTTGGTKCTVCGTIPGAVSTPAKGHTWERDGFDVDDEANQTTEMGFTVDQAPAPGKEGKGHFTCQDPNCDDKEHNTKEVTLAAEASEYPKTLHTVGLTILRGTPSDDGAYKGYVVSGTAFEVNGPAVGGFYAVTYNGETCYIHEDYLQ